MKSRMILDYAGTYVNDPGVIRFRIRRVHYRDDNTVIDDGTRSGIKQTNAISMLLDRDRDIEQSVKFALTRFKGYELPNTALMHSIAEHERAEKTINARKEALRVNGPTLRLAVHSLGFDVVGAGELAIGFGKYIISGPDDIQLSEKASIKLLPGDPLDIVLDALAQYATEIDFQPPTAMDFSLLRCVTAALWTPERVANRQNQWLNWERTAPFSIAQGRSIELAERLLPIGDWRNVPTEQPARLN